MNYLKIYNNIISKAQNEKRKKNVEKYYESHHIIPKCLGGTGSVKQWKNHPNIVLLTSREHFICHWLLHLIYPDNKKLAMSFWTMCVLKNNKQSRYIPSSKVYEYAKLQMIETKKGKDGYWKGKKLYDSTKLKISKSKIGVPIHTEETKRKNALRHKGNTYRLGKEHSDGSKALMSESGKKNYLDNPERKIIHSKKMKNRKQNKVKCPYCDKEGGNTMGRWHFENCKYK